ncbi:MAG: diacylglycerol/lipid kinase family protein [Actinomycetota bacterium]
MKTLLVYNTLSGRISQKVLQKVEDKLINAGFSIDPIESNEVGQAYIKIREALEERGNIDFVTALGGDGIINEAVNALAYTDVPLGIIPYGTTNAFAKEKNIPLSAGRAIKLFKEQNIKTMDLGLINDKKYFIMMCSYGFDVSAISEISIMVKKRLKVFAYLFYGTKAFLFHNPVKIMVRVEAEGKEYSGYFCIINNVKSYGNPLAKITPHASVNDGLLDVCIFKKCSKFSFLKNIIGIFTTRHINYRDVLYFQTCSRIDIDIEDENKKDRKNLGVQLDGDVLSFLPLSVKCARGALKIFLP